MRCLCTYRISLFYVGKVYINVLNSLICFQGNGKIVRSLEAHAGNDRVWRKRAAKAARINISPRVEIMIPGACWPSHKSWAHLRDRCADNSGAVSRSRLSRIHDLGVSREPMIINVKGTLG